MIVVVNIFIGLYVLFFPTNLHDVLGIWPPPYSVNLSHEEVFVISELLEQSDIQDVYDEDEMIKKEDLAERLNPYLNNDKYFRIHQQVRRYSDKVSPEKSYNVNDSKLFEEFNPDVEGSIPWKAGYVDENGKFKQDEDIIYFDGEQESEIDDSKLKRSEEETVNKNDTISYDYNSFKSNYENNIKAAEEANDTVQYSTVKEEESIKESVEEIVDFKKTPRNCTAEEIKGIGLGAIECFWLEAQKPKMKNHMLERVIRIILIWVVLYVIIAIPCWCQYGWCCCCCRCKFCNPRENISEVHKFFAQNPLGVYHADDGNVYTYKPTNYEKYAYKKLENALGKL